MICRNNGANMLRILVASVALIIAGLVSAQSYPARQVRIVVPFPPGGTSDILARTIGARLSAPLGQPVVIDNRPGAGGNIAADHVPLSVAEFVRIQHLRVAVKLNSHEFS